MRRCDSCKKTFQDSKDVFCPHCGAVASKSRVSSHAAEDPRWNRQDAYRGGTRNPHGDFGDRGGNLSGSYSGSAVSGQRTNYEAAAGAAPGANNPHADMPSGGSTMPASGKSYQPYSGSGSASGSSPLPGGVLGKILHEIETVATDVKNAGEAQKQKNTAAKNPGKAIATLIAVVVGLNLVFGVFSAVFSKLDDSSEPWNETENTSYVSLSGEVRSAMLSAFDDGSFYVSIKDAGYSVVSGENALIEDGENGIDLFTSFDYGSIDICALNQDELDSLTLEELSNRTELLQAEGSPSQTLHFSDSGIEKEHYYYISGVSYVGEDVDIYWELPFNCFYVDEKNAVTYWLLRDSAYGGLELTQTSNTNPKESNSDWDYYADFS